MLKDFLENLRYDRPILFKSAIGGTVFLVLFIGFMSLPTSPLMEALGVVTGQKKVGALYYALVWDARAATNRGGATLIVRSLYGSMVGVERNGNLVISTAVGDKFVQSSVRIADVKLTNLNGVASMIEDMRGNDAKFDYYSQDEVVVWVRGAPFNVKLIEAGHASPDPKPPTNVVDKAFATYYWRILNGSSN